MNRREAIKRTSMMLGVAISSPAVLSILNGCVPKKTVNWQPQFFTQDQAVLVGEIAEIILPKTDTPGAKDIGVDAFIDHIVNNCYSDEAKAQFIAGLEEVDKESNLKEGDIFINMTSEKKNELLTDIENKAARVDIETATKEQPFFAKIKELTLLGYFTSEEIMTKYLEYVPIPGRLEGCNDLEPNQKLIVGNHV